MSYLADEVGRLRTAIRLAMDKIDSLQREIEALKRENERLKREAYSG